MSNNSGRAKIRFYVTPHGDDWDVAVDREPPIRFEDRATAVTAAVAGARKIWESFHESASVQIQDENGWHVMRRFGT